MNDVVKSWTVEKKKKRMLYLNFPISIRLVADELLGSFLHNIWLDKRPNSHDVNLEKRKVKKKIMTFFHSTEMTVWRCL